ncbi:hypothetical protein D8X55_01650 [Malacoplasma penetrans]|uniref:Cyclophilin-like domain-containing protein n=1 Tax=Malacoplasma penetrans (strain HF-2) TaxID=272633 RepID=Q8EWN5_MALP2|nr:cyclophilin-like fold protein [Malacoplasma penetrans]RXY96978.1 hypothetical protein D8X55_01650 [Malacoplasma penetrans]BAC43959.1 hypothetical protein [Malacoplasma penetrans HF-2]
MNKYLSLIPTLGLGLLAFGCSSNSNSNNDNSNSIDSNNSDSNNNWNNNVKSLVININGQPFNTILESNSTVNSFLNLLPLSNLNMNDLNSNEKYIYLSETLNTNTYKPGIINAGDVMLYGNNCLVIFYKTFTSNYSYSKIGTIENVDELVDLLDTRNSVNVSIDFN